jgi:hypothetical protein
MARALTHCSHGEQHNILNPSNPSKIKTIWASVCVYNMKYLIYVLLDIL